MTDIIEQDALNDTTYQAPPPTEAHTHEVKSFVATPRMDQSFMEKMVGLFKARDKPGMHVLHKSDDPLRFMVIVTSNSYEDREGETITSAALKAYEDSCYPGEGLFHCDNPLLWWHDDDIVMGEIVAVNYSEPFLIEVARELPTPVSKVLFDYAEANGDNAGASHRFGYMEKDRDPDGTFHRIFKQETSYLPERALAANSGTYAGVLGMASPQSDKRIDAIFEPLGIKGAAAKFHAKTGEIEKEFEALGIIHKAAKPPFPPKPAADAVVNADEAVIEADAVDEEEDVKEEMEAGGKLDITRFMVLMNGVMNMLGDMMDTQAASEMDRVGMMKAFDELKEARVSEKAADKVTIEALMEKLKSLEERQSATETRLNLQPRSVTQEKGHTPEDAVKLMVEGAEKARVEAEMINDPFWGPMKPLPK